jgi:hypothetical protein
MSEDESTGPQKGLSRRSFITRGALATGAVVWATPVVDSFISKAVAGSASPCQCASSGDRITVTPSNGGDTLAFTAAQQSGLCAGDCSGNCANNDTNAPTTYRWEFVGTPPSPSSTTVTVYTVPQGPSYTMGTDLTNAANGVVDCAPTLTDLSTLTLNFASPPAAFTVRFSYNVICDPARNITCFNHVDSSSS